MSRPVDTVIEFLKTEQTRGKTHVFLDDAARTALRELYLRTQSKPAAPAPARATPAPQAAVLKAEAPPEPVAAPVPTHVTATGATKAERLASLRSQAESWAPARSLGTLRDTIVFASGNPEARLMLIGEAPGYEDERKREPFAGPAGQKLNDILKAMGIARDDAYLTNIVKFRPAAPRQTTNNRKPSPEELAAFLPFIRAEIDVIQPTCILALGATAAEGLLGLTGAIAAMRGSWHDFHGTPVRVTLHPGSLLHTSADLSTKRQLWEDMLSIMEKLELPISDRQRGFFLPKP